MIDYIKKELKHLPFTIIVFIMLYGITVFANSYALNSTDVSFDNDGTSITATNMQNAISELYDRAIDYSSIDTRVSDLESAVGNSSLTTTASTITGAINELDGDISTLDSNITGKLSKMFKIYSTSGSTTSITANTTFELSCPLSVPSGYKPVALLGWDMNNRVQVYVDSVKIDGNTVKCRGLMGPSTDNFCLSVTVLLTKSEFID